MKFFLLTLAAVTGLSVGVAFKSLAQPQSNPIVNSTFEASPENFIFANSAGGLNAGGASCGS